MQREKKKSMTWVLFALSAALAWGFYGAMLHRGQVGLGNPMKALLCVGVAYFLIGVLAPVFTLASQGALGGFSKQGATWAFVSGALGAIGGAHVASRATAIHRARSCRCARFGLAAHRSGMRLDECPVRVVASARIRRRTSRPSILGRFRSIKTMAGRSSASRSSYLPVPKRY